MRTSYSRRELYALGEPLGDSATYLKAGGGYILGDGGGGGGSAPANTTSTSTQLAELPEWARGYAKDTLAKGAALTDVNQNPNNIVATGLLGSHLCNNRLCRTRKV